MMNSDLAYQLWYEAEQRQRRLETLYLPHRTARAPRRRLVRFGRHVV
jgi:hypothetical protein